MNARMALISTSVVLLMSVDAGPLAAQRGGGRRNAGSIQIDGQSGPNASPDTGGNVEFSERHRRRESAAETRGPGGGLNLRLGPPPANLLLLVLDANSDGELSEKELKNAEQSLKKLDKNRDGQLSKPELSSQGFRGFGRPRPTNHGENVRRQRAGAAVQSSSAKAQLSPGARPNASPEAFLKHLMKYDKNQDAKLSKDELPEKIQGLIDHVDTDKDGVVSKEELVKRLQGAASE